MKKDNLVIIALFTMCVVICSATHSAGTYQSRFDYNFKGKEVIPSEDTPSISSHMSSTNNYAKKQEQVSGFRHIYSLDMAIPGEECPDGLREITGSVRTCGKGSSGPGCDSVMISPGGVTYQYIRGKLSGYQYGAPDAFAGRSSPSIDGNYVDGVSITHGQSPRKHIWTYAVGAHAKQPDTNYWGVACPGTRHGTAQPAFVGIDYFCASGNPNPTKWQRKLYDDIRLWSNIRGNCNECNDNDLYFCVKLSEATTDDIELRVCTDEHYSSEDIRLETIDFYVK